MSTGTRRGNSLITGSTNGGDLVNVPVTEEGHLEVAIHGPRLPFGSVHTESISPILQADAVYGINLAELIATTGHAVTPGAANTGSNTGTNNLFKCSTGTTQYSFASLQSRRRLRYRPGQGIVGRFTALFSTPAANSTLVAGMGTAESGVYFGYNGTSFGILHSSGGVREIQTLTITTASTATNDYNVQLGGVTTNVTATNNGSTTKTAYEIAQGTYPGWKAEARGATVLFLADSVGNKSGTFSLAQSGAATPAAGTYAETTAGVAGTDTWIPQSSWNGDPLDGTGPTGATLDPSKGNVFQIKVQYLGFGTITFEVEVASAGNNPEWVVVHQIRYPNTSATVSLTQPAFPFTMAAYSGGSTTDVWVACGSYGGFVEGAVNNIGPRTNIQRTTNGFVGSTASTYYPLFTIRNDLVHSHAGSNSRANQSVVYPLSISCSHDDATPVNFYLIRNATLVGTPNFSRYSANSCIYVDTAATTATAADDKVVFLYTQGQNSGGTYRFDDVITLQPGETLTLAAVAVTGTATYVIGSLNIREDQ